MGPITVYRNMYKSIYIILNFLTSLWGGVTPYGLTSADDIASNTSSGNIWPQSYSGQNFSVPEPTTPDMYPPFPFRINFVTLVFRHRIALVSAF